MGIYTLVLNPFVNGILISFLNKFHILSVIIYLLGVFYKYYIF